MRTFFEVVHLGAWEIIVGLCFKNWLVFSEKFFTLMAWSMYVLS